MHNMPGEISWNVYARDTTKPYYHLCFTVLVTIFTCSSSTNNEIAAVLTMSPLLIPGWTPPMESWMWHPSYL